MPQLFASSAWLPTGWATNVLLTIDASGRWSDITTDVATPPADALRRAGVRAGNASAGAIRRTRACARAISWDSNWSTPRTEANSTRVGLAGTEMSARTAASESRDCACRSMIRATSVAGGSGRYRLGRPSSTRAAPFLPSKQFSAYQYPGSIQKYVPNFLLHH